MACNTKVFEKTRSRNFINSQEGNSLENRLEGCRAGYCYGRARFTKGSGFVKKDLKKKEEIQTYESSMKLRERRGRKEEKIKVCRRQRMATAQRSMGKGFYRDLKIRMFFLLQEMNKF